MAEDLEQRILKLEALVKALWDAACSSGHQPKLPEEAAPEPEAPPAE
jgi:hypothetical protein